MVELEKEIVTEFFDPAMSRTPAILFKLGSVCGVNAETTSHLPARAAESRKSGLILVDFDM
jgi:hypothetical protein